MKKILDNSVLGQRGVNLIEKVVLDMGFIWTPAGTIEAGIDGIIETRDSNTGEMFNSILQVQSKAVSQFTSETTDTFEYSCRENDLQYWLGGNAPVLLIVSCPDRNEAYWVSIKDFFHDLARRKTRKVIFNKKSDRFSLASRTEILKIAVPKESGIYLSPLLKPETLHSNLLAVKHFGSKIYVADTPFRYRWQVFDLAKSRGAAIGPEWELWGKRIVSFDDLNADEWDYACDAGTIESFDAGEWADSESRDQRNIVLAILNRSLRRLVKHKGLDHDDKHEAFYFKATPDLKPQKYRYKSLLKQAERAVFQHYPTKLQDNQTPSYYRHSAFQSRFLRLDGQYLLEITPTYHFTWDGIHRYRFAEDRLKGIKKLEKNAALLGQVVMWAEFLSKDPGLFDYPSPHLKFSDLQTFELSRGINDRQWLPAEDDAAKQLEKEMTEEESLFVTED